MTPQGTKKPLSVVIGIPTYKRPLGLQKILSCIARQTGLPAPLRVIVADNEGENGTGRATVETIRQDGVPFALESFGVDGRGVSHVRNALMHTAFSEMGADALVMFDDDLWIGETALDALLTMQKNTSADIVYGPVVADFENAAPAWAGKMQVYFRAPRKPGVTRRPCGAGGVLLMRSVYTAAQAQGFFNPDFSMTGGEDTEFFTRMLHHGLVFAYTPDCILHETYDSSRATKKWAIKRAFRIGIIYTRVLRIHKPDTKNLVTAVARWGINLARGCAYILAYPFSPATGMRGVELLVIQTGKIAGLFWTGPDEYKATHGT